MNRRAMLRESFRGLTRVMPGMLGVINGVIKDKKETKHRERPACFPIGSMKRGAENEQKINGQEE